MVTDRESVCSKTMGTSVTAPLDIEARIAKLLNIVMVSFVVVMGRALMDLMTMHRLQCIVYGQGL